MTHDPRHDAFDSRAATYTSTRVARYNQANACHPYARETERRILIDGLDLRPGLDICDVAAGGGYLSDGIHERLGGRCRIICLENSAHFSESLPDRYERVLCSLSDIALPDVSVDRVACLAGLHHQEDKQRFFQEAHRILRPRGVIGVGDVLAGSTAGRFLNEAVDRWSDLGHDGMFFVPGELTVLMENAGFVDTTERLHEYTWTFPDLPALVWFCKVLFRMEKGDLEDVEKELRRYLRIEVSAEAACLHWSLVYGFARKS